MGSCKNCVFWDGNLPDHTNNGVHIENDVWMYYCQNPKFYITYKDVLVGIDERTKNYLTEGNFSCVCFKDKL